MSYRQLGLLVLLAAAMVTAHRSADGVTTTADKRISPMVAPSRAYAAPLASPRRAVEPAAAERVNIASGTERLRESAGMLGSRIVARRVSAMTARTERLVDELMPKVEIASPDRRVRAMDLTLQIRSLESEAASSLEEGRPVVAIRAAMKGRGLVSAVRSQVLEESSR
jgi:hypothetical protein